MPCYLPVLQVRTRPCGIGTGQYEGLLVKSFSDPGAVP
jgi:hypothetical protein